MSLLNDVKDRLNIKTNKYDKYIIEQINEMNKIEQLGGVDILSSIELKENFKNLGLDFKSLKDKRTRYHQKHIKDLKLKRDFNRRGLYPPIEMFLYLYNYLSIVDYYGVNSLRNNDLTLNTYIYLIYNLCKPLSEILNVNIHIEFKSFDRNTFSFYLTEINEKILKYLQSLIPEVGTGITYDYPMTENEMIIYKNNGEDFKYILKSLNVERPNKYNIEKYNFAVKIANKNLDKCTFDPNKSRDKVISQEYAFGGDTLVEIHIDELSTNSLITSNYDFVVDELHQFFIENIDTPYVALGTISDDYYISKEIY